MNARWGQPAETLPADHPAWKLEAHYIALAMANFIVTISPQRIILGGGVMSGPHMFPALRSEVLELLNGYVQSPAILQHIDEYIVPPGLGNRSASGRVRAGRSGCFVSEVHVWGFDEKVAPVFRRHLFVEPPNVYLT